MMSPSSRAESSSTTALASGRPASNDSRAVGGRLRRQRPHRALRAQHASLPLEQHEGEIVTVEARIELRRALYVEALYRDALRGQRSLGGGLPSVVPVGEPRHPTLHEQVLTRLLLEFAPQASRAVGHGRVFGVGAVRAAKQPRLTARTGAGVARLELVDQRDLLSRSREPPRERGAEGPRPDDHGLHRIETITVRAPSRTSCVASVSWS